ncbi:hypothetical protein [Thiocystis violacea]|uniref:hypothetical protein n=1 Tax=Thiocystis violacea TaxID=13725 RepID=UPI001904F8FF|nr:hypothetical protein [Thiocystis violacea]
MKTSRTAFYAIPVAGPAAHVFDVRAGTPVHVALELASSMLWTALQTLTDVGGDLGLHPESCRLYAAIYTLEQVHGLVDASVPAALGCGGDNPRRMILELSEHEAVQLARIAEAEGRDLSATATSLLAGALRRHAVAVSGGNE